MQKFKKNKTMDEPDLKILKAGLEGPPKRYRITKKTQRAQTAQPVHSLAIGRASSEKTKDKTTNPKGRYDPKFGRINKMSCVVIATSVHAVESHMKNPISSGLQSVYWPPRWYSCCISHSPTFFPQPQARGKTSKAITSLKDTCSRWIR